MAITDPLINPCVDEIEVANILLEFSQFVFQPRSFFSWGRKRKRSDIARYDALSLPETATVTAPATEASPSPISVMGMGMGMDPVSEAAVLAVKAEASNLSPDTPLSFSPSTESDEKEKAMIPRKKAKVSIKKRREGLLKNLDELTQRKQLLVLEINHARLRYELLKQDNMRLKELVGGGRVAVEPHLELETMSGVVNSGRSQVKDEAIQPTFYERRMGEDRTAEIERAMVWQAGGRVYDKVVGPLDLNVSAEEAAARGLEDGRAKAAQARFHRKLKMNKWRSIYTNASSTHRIFPSSVSS